MTVCSSTVETMAPVVLTKIINALTIGSYSADDTFNVVNPDNGQVVASLPRQRQANVSEALSRAKRFDGEPVMPLHERIRIIISVVDIVKSEREVFAHALAAEGVKTLAEAISEVNRCVETLTLSAVAAQTLVGELIPFGATARLSSHHGYFRFGPVGVTAALTPYNDPLNLVAHKLGPALAAGNSVVLYADQRTPISALLLCSAFWRAGTSTDQLQLLLGEGGEIVPALLSDSRVRAITATGGGRLARAVKENVGARKLILELGGVCPSVVSRDADLDLAVDKLSAGAVSAAGQNCLHPQIIAVDEPVYEEFLHKLAQKLDQVNSGSKFDPETDCGPLIDESGTARVDSFIADARAKGAIPVVGGEQTLTALHRRPLLLRDVPHDARIWNEEVFGPVTAVRRVKGITEGLRAVSRSGGLQASLFTTNLETADTAIATLRHPSVAINDADLRYDGMPFGGDGTAGLNREGPAFAIKELSSIQSVLQRRSATTSSSLYSELS